MERSYNKFPFSELINKSMDNKTKKPDFEGVVQFADFLVIRDKQTKQILHKTRGR
jgi:hypothetical protein